MNQTLINQNQWEQLTCYLLPVKNEFCLNEFFSPYEKTYAFWHDIIQSALREEKNFKEANQLSSDFFMENDEAVVLFYQDEPVGLFMFRWIDTKYTANRALNALTKRFPKELLDSLYEKKLFHTMLMGQLAVAPLWRKSSRGLGISEILMGFAVTRFLESTAETLLTTTRNNRKTNDLCYRQGGKKFADNGKVFGVESDVVFFDRHDIKPIESLVLREITQQLWQQKKVGWVG